MRRYVILLAAATAALTAEAALAQTEIKIEPRGAYLRTYNDSGALNCAPIQLSALGIYPGDWIRLEQMGDFCPGSIFTDSSTTLSGVFSSTSTLLSLTTAHRVPDAIPAGRPIVTGNTYYGSYPTDIPEDFRITNTVIRVPAGAEFLMVNPPDSLFHDNTDPDGDYKLRISRVSPVYASNLSAGSPVIGVAKDGWAFIVWGEVTFIDADSFFVDDGSRAAVKVYAPGHGKQTGDYVSAGGTFGDPASPFTLMSAASQVDARR